MYYVIEHEIPLTDIFSFLPFCREHNFTLENTLSKFVPIYTISWFFHFCLQFIFQK